MKPISAAKAPQRKASQPTAPFAARQNTGAAKAPVAGRNTAPAQNRASATKRNK